MPQYELVYIIPTTLADEEINKTKEEISKIANEIGLKIIKEELLGKKKMAYGIKKVRHGNYYSLVFDGQGDQLEKLKRELKLNHTVVRSVITRWQPEKVINSLPKEPRKLKPKKEEEKIVTEPETPKIKVSLEDLDKKLDEILEGNIE